ncbi:TPA: hypothetical protein VGT10_004995, partial [Enterobacter cloacae]|nr:hypothetical protein [Enterobacter cloacae]
MELSCLEDVTTNQADIYFWSKKKPGSLLIYRACTLSDTRLTDKVVSKVPILDLFSRQSGLPVCHPISRSGVYISNFIRHYDDYVKTERAILTEVGKSYTLSGDLTVIKKNYAPFKNPEVYLQVGDTVIACHALNAGELNTPGRRLPLSLTFPLSAISSDSSQTVTLAVRESGKTGGPLVTLFEFLRDAVDDNTLLTLHTAGNGAQSMVWGFNAVNRVRLNTLFGPELASRAARGLDTILSLASQSLPEPAIRPKGARVTLTLDKYTPAVHGTTRTVTLRHTEIFDDDRSDLLFQGELSP